MPAMATPLGHGVHEKPSDASPPLMLRHNEAIDLDNAWGLQQMAIVGLYPAHDFVFVDRSKRNPRVISAHDPGPHRRRRHLIAQLIGKRRNRCGVTWGQLPHVELEHDATLPDTSI